MIPITGFTMTVRATAPAVAAVATIPFRLATTLLRCTSELATSAGCTMGWHLSNDVAARTHPLRAPGHRTRDHHPTAVQACDLRTGLGPAPSWIRGLP